MSVFTIVDVEFTQPLTVLLALITYDDVPDTGELKYNTEAEPPV
jgi:hypothetical protein